MVQQEVTYKGKTISMKKIKGLKPSRNVEENGAAASKSQTQRRVIVVNMKKKDSKKSINPKDDRYDMNEGASFERDDVVTRDDQRIGEEPVKQQQPGVLEIMDREFLKLGEFVGEGAVSIGKQISQLGR